MSRYANRTLFYGLALKGTGTGQVESLRSYIPRLALEHSLTPFKLLEHLYEKYPMDAVGTSIRSTLTSWDVQTLAEKGNQVRERLEAATGVSLDGSSMSRFQGVFSANNLMRNSGWMFCPHCIAHEGGMYSRLLWDIKGVKACPIHETYLVPSGTCGKPESRLANHCRVNLSTVCSECGSVGLLCAHHKTERASAGDVSRARAMEKILAMGPVAEEGISGNTLRSGLRDLVAGAFENKPTCASLECGLARSSFRGWLRGARVPSLAGLLKVCDRTGADITELLRGRYAKVKTPTHLVEGPRINKRVVLDEVAVRALFAAATMKTPPRSLTSIGRELGVDMNRLKRDFPAECVALRKACSDELKAKRDSAYLDAVEAYKDAALRLRTKGKHVGPRYVQEEARMAAFSRNTDRHNALIEGMRLALETPASSLAAEPSSLESHA